MKNLVDLRKENNTTQKSLALHLGISQGNLCDWEKGRSEPDISTLVKIANYFNVSIDYLVGNANYDGTISYQDIANSPNHEFISIYSSLTTEDKDLVNNIVSRLKQSK